MSEILELSVPRIVNEIDVIEKETETVYLKLGQVFQTIKKAVDISALDTENILKNVLNEYRGGLSVGAFQNRLDSFIAESFVFFDNAAKTEKAFMSGVETGIESLSHLDAVLCRIRADSEEMEIVSLNAMTAALKSGSAGRAFSVITDELKKLSGKTIIHADNLSLAGSELKNKLEKLKKTLDTLSVTQNDFFNYTKSALETGFQELDKEVNDTANSIRLLGKDAASVREPVSQIMQEVQLQDIIRQSLDHVILSLNSIESILAEDKDEKDERASLVEIAHLSSDLMMDIEKQTRDSLERFRIGMAGVNGVMERVESSRKSMKLNVEDKNEALEFDNKAEAYLVAKKNAAKEATAINEGVKQLSIRFREMDSILSRFKNIVTASRIEIARNKALAIVSTTVLGMMELTENLAEDVEATGNLTKSFSNVMNAGMADYLTESDEKTDLLRKQIGNLRSEFDTLANSKKSLYEAESNFKPFSTDFENSVIEANNAAKHIDELANEIAGIKKLFSDYVMDNDNGEQSSAIHSEKFQAIVDRFTIFSHKQTANRIANLSIDDESVNSGDVTLF